VRSALGAFSVGAVHETRATVEDAFVSMVRAEPSDGAIE